MIGRILVRSLGSIFMLLAITSCTVRTSKSVSEAQHANIVTVRYTNVAQANYGAIEKVLSSYFSYIDKESMECTPRADGKSGLCTIELISYKPASAPNYATWAKEITLRVSTIDPSAIPFYESRITGEP